MKILQSYLKIPHKHTAETGMQLLPKTVSIIDCENLKILINNKLTITVPYLP
jgi:hypothetical protein